MQCISDVVFPIMQSTFDSFALLVFYTLVDRYSVTKANWVIFVSIRALDSYVEKHFRVFIFVPVTVQYSSINYFC